MRYLTPIIYYLKDIVKLGKTGWIVNICIRLLHPHFADYKQIVGNLKNVYPGYILMDYRTLYANNANLSERQV